MTLVPPPATGAAVTATLVLAQQPGTNDTPGKEEFGKSSPLGLVVLLLFLIAVALLVRSMTKHLKRIPESFDEPGEQDAGRDQDGPSAGEQAKATDEPTPDPADQEPESSTAEQTGAARRDDPGGPSAP